MTIVKKYLTLILALLCVSVVAMAQTTPVTSVPYFCGFEETSENQNWVLNRRGTFGASTPLPSSWIISTGAKHSGIKGLYIYTHDNPDVAEYDGTREVFAVAEREFQLPAGTYDLALDWRCLGDTLNDAVYVYWIPNTITNMTSRTTSALPTNATPLQFNNKAFLSGSAKWRQSFTTITVGSAASYKLVIAWRNNTTNTYNPGGCIDNVQIQRHQSSTDCWHMVNGLAWTQGEVSDLLSWNAQPGATFDIFYWLEGSVQQDSILGLTNNSYTFSHGDLASGLYCFAVRTNCGSEQSLLYELLNVKSLGTYSMVASACPEVNLLANIVDGEKYLNPLCDEAGKFKVKPSTVAGGGSIAGYRVDRIDYNDCPFPFDLNLLPPPFRNKITTITRDDYWDTRLIDLPFAVCFYDGTYRQALVGANGIVSFDPSIKPGSTCAWSLTAQPDIPNTRFIYKNCIMGVYQDYYPVPSAGGLQQIWYGVLGEWPCRKMVVCFNEVPMFSHHEVLNSSMIVMYEGTNVIDVYVKNRDISTTSVWNDNRGIIGIINADGTEGLAAPGRNTTDGTNNGKAWSAHNEAWRFSPYSTPAYMLSWYNGAFNTPDDIDAYLNAHPDEDIQLSVGDSIDINEEDGINSVTVRLQYSQCNGDYIDIVDHAFISWPHPDTLQIDTFTCTGKPYSDQWINRASKPGMYEAAIPNTRGCDSVIYQVNLEVLPIDTIPLDTTVCAGQTLEIEGQTITAAGKHTVRVHYPQCDCDSILYNIDLSILDQLSVNVLDFPELVCADDSFLTFTLETMGEVSYSVHFIPEGQGLQDVLDATSADGNIAIPLPKGVLPRDYKMCLEVEDKSCGNFYDTIPFMVHYAASIAPQKWSNVLVLLDTPQNGGYTFSQIQWYKDGNLIPNATGPYLYLGEDVAFDPNASYTVGLTRAGETYEVQSCPLGDALNMTDLQDQAVDPTHLPASFNGMMQVYDVAGLELMNGPYDLARLTTFINGRAHGVYVVKLLSANQQYVYRISRH